jgi:hypothetical protein
MRSPVVGDLANGTGSDAQADKSPIPRQSAMTIKIDLELFKSYIPFDVKYVVSVAA